MIKTYQSNQCPYLIRAVVLENEVSYQDVDRSNCRVVKLELIEQKANRRIVLAVLTIGHNKKKNVSINSNASFDEVDLIRFTINAVEMLVEKMTSIEDNDLIDLVTDIEGKEFCQIVDNLITQSAFNLNIAIQEKESFKLLRERELSKEKSLNIVNQ